MHTIVIKMIDFMSLVGTSTNEKYIETLLTKMAVAEGLDIKKPYNVGSTSDSFTFVQKD
jgi:hypothetical protein